MGRLTDRYRERNGLEQEGVNGDANRVRAAPSRDGNAEETGGDSAFWRWSMYEACLPLDEEAVRRVRFVRRKPRVETELSRAIGTKDRLRLSHIDVDVRMVLRRRNADAVESSDPDTDFRNASVIPEFRVSDAGCRLVHDHLDGSHRGQQRPRAVPFH